MLKDSGTDCLWGMERRAAEAEWNVKCGGCRGLCVWQ